MMIADMKTKTFKLSHWIVLVAVTGALPLLIVTLYIISASINSDIEFNAREVKGNAFQRPLSQLLDLLPRHDAAARRAASGDASAKSDLTQLAAKIDAVFNSLSDVHAQFGEVLQFTESGLASRQRDNARLDRVLEQWNRLRTAGNAGVADSAACGQLIQAVRTMHTHAGDTSNLILDPDLDSYYVMDMTVCALPQTQDRIGRITLEVAGWLRRGEAANRKTEAAVMAALLREADRDRVVADSQTALNEDANFGGKSESLQAMLPSAVSRYQKATDNFLEQLEQIAAGNPLPAADEFERVGWLALAEAANLWSTASTELDVLIKTRISGYTNRRLLSYCAMACGGVFVSVVLWLILRRLNRQLRDLNGRLSENARAVTMEAMQISAASESLASGANQQAASLEETSASLDAMAAVIQQNAEHSQRADALAREARTAADGGVSDMQMMNTAMVAIKASSDDVANIIKSINEIAFQTNILALNAAVEAARAGEAGAGFAVVADEVRSLAQRSAAAAKETEQKIQSAISRTAQGVEISRKVESVLQEIVTRVREVSELIAEVASASREQSQGIGQINAAVGQLEKVTQSNAAIAEQSASAVQGLKQQSTAMNQAIEELVALVNNDSAQIQVPGAAAAAAIPSKSSSPRPARRHPARVTEPVLAEH